MLSETRKKKLEANIWKFYIYRVFASLVFVTPIFVLFLQENGLSMTQVMILQSIYTAIIMLSLVPSGILADYLGRKKVIVFSTVVYMAGWFIYGLGTSFAHFIIAESVFGICAAAWMASGTAFFYDNLRELRIEGKFKRLFGNVIGITLLAEGAAALAGGYIATYANSFRLPFWVTGFVVILAVAFSFSLTETKSYKHGDIHYLTHLKNASKFAATHPRVRLFIIYSAVLMAISFAVYMFQQPYFKAISIPLVYFGWIYLGISLLAALGAKTAHRIEKYLGERKILILLLVVAVVCLFGMSRLSPFFGVVFPLVLALNWGIFFPVINDYLNKHIESHHRATVLSLHELVVQFFATLSAPVFGWIFDFWSLTEVFNTMVVILIINLLILVGVFTIIRRREK